jgi:hypothetical protein
MMHDAARFAFAALNLSRTPDETGWRNLLAFADRTQLTLLLANAPGQPEWVRREIAGRAEKNLERLHRLQSAYRELSTAFDAEVIEYVLLKGFTHAAFGIDPALRVQYDLDVLCPPDQVERAVSSLRRLGYAPHSERSLSDQHLAPMVKPGDWKWAGDYFDPNIPIAVDLHTSAWSDEIDRIRLTGPDLFWQRRCRDYHAFSLVDRVAYAALHALRHTLRNDARPAHVYELACFLDARAHDYRFWNTWSAIHDPQLRRVQAVAFRFAHAWFRCGIPDAVDREFKMLNPRIQAWFNNFAWSPVSNLTHSNKDIVWLHMALLTSVRDRMTVLRRRLVPLHRPAKQERDGVACKIRRHVSAIGPALASGLRWWRRPTAS